MKRYITQCGKLGISAFITDFILQSWKLTDQCLKIHAKWPVALLDP